MRKQKVDKRYASEAELCEQLVGAARAHGFQAFPETADFDVLLVAGSRATGFAEGEQVGVQAKLHPNLAVLHQTLLAQRRPTRPGLFAVLVPDASDAFRDVARELKVTVLTGIRLSDPRERFPLTRPVWYRVPTAKPCWVPECEVEGMAAGTSAPLQLTPWKMKAVKLAMRGAMRGYLTRRDFAEHDVSIQRWIKMGWIVAYDYVVENGRRVARYVLNDDKNPPHLRYHEVACALEKAGAL